MSILNFTQYHKMNYNYSKLLRSQRFFIFMIIILLTLTYFQTLSYELIYLDDETIINKKFEGLNTFEKVLFSFTSNYLGGHYYRPVALLTLVMDSLFAGKSYFIYHFTNFIIHFLTSIIVFLSVKKLGYSLIIAFLTALLFALNPIHVNAVGWIAGRGDLLAAFFSIVALFIYLKVIQENKLFLLFIIFISLFLAILSKEVSLLVPLLFLPFYFIEKKVLLLDRINISILSMMLFVFILYYLLREVFLPEVNLDKFSFTAIYKNILILPETISKFLIPFGIKALSRFEYFTSISGIIIFIILLLIPLKLKSINRLRYYFGLLWFVFLLIPGLVTRTMEQDGFYYWDCRSYLPSIGLIFVASEILKVMDLQKYRIQFFTLIIIYLFAQGTITFFKVKLYENPIRFWNAVKTDYPYNFLPYVGLYNYFNESKDLSNAEAQLLKAIEVSPNDLSLRQILNNFYLVNNKNEKAFYLLKDTFNKRVSGYANFIETYVLLCIGLDRLKDLEELIIENSKNNTINEKIRRALIQKAESLKQSGDIQKSNILIEKVKKMN